MIPNPPSGPCALGLAAVLAAICSCAEEDPEDGPRPDTSATNPGRPARAISLTPYPDGPVVLRGPFRLVDPSGAEVRTHRRAVALCRCGRSRLGAVCDGTHRSTGFRAPGGPPREVAQVVTVPLVAETG